MQISGGNPSDSEAAAVIAAVQQFLNEFAVGTEWAEPVNNWHRTALLEGAGYVDTEQSPWGQQTGW